jgi:hypothetical protein
MNENILKIIEHAERYSIIFSTLENGRKELFREKITELLVKECISICKSKIGNADYTTGRLSCADDISKHFGFVENMSETKN